MTALRAARLFDGAAFIEDATVTLDGGRIVDLAERADGERLPSDWLLAPGFVDLQVNGGGGVLFNDDTTATGAIAIAEAHARAGTTALLPTLVSDHTRYAAALQAVEDARAHPGVVGLHLEGPFLNPARRGIHPERALGPPTPEDLDRLCHAHRFPVLLTLAPETLTLDALARLAGTGLLLFAGHTDATGDEAEAAFARGVRGATHLFNAMSQLGSRAPGVVGATLAHASASAGIIVDGLHVHPLSVRLAWRAIGPDRLFLVSDAMPTAASDISAFTWDGEVITLRGGRLARADGTLAGAHLTMAEAVARAVRLCGIPLGDTLRMATRTPARVLGTMDLGHLGPGARADMVALDPALRVVAVWQAGRRLEPLAA